MTPERIEKLMALKAPEFELSLGRLAPDHTVETPGMSYRVDLTPDSWVSITLTPQPDALLGGLVKMPRALVKIAFINVPPDERSSFMKRFDQAFQRGGG